MFRKNLLEKSFNDFFSVLGSHLSNFPVKLEMEVPGVTKREQPCLAQILLVPGEWGNSLSEMAGS